MSIDVYEDGGRFYVVKIGPIANPRVIDSGGATKTGPIEFYDGNQWVARAGMPTNKPSVGLSFETRGQAEEYIAGLRG